MTPFFHEENAVGQACDADPTLMGGQPQFLWKEQWVFWVLGTPKMGQNTLARICMCIFFFDLFLLIKNGLLLRFGTHFMLDLNFMFHVFYFSQNCPFSLHKPISEVLLMKHATALCFGQTGIPTPIYRFLLDGHLLSGIGVIWPHTEAIQ